MSPVGHGSKTATISVKCRLEIISKFVGVVKEIVLVLYIKKNMASKCCKKKLLIVDTYASNYYELIPYIFQGSHEFLERFQVFIGCCS
jgi:hypothetical protein